MLRAILKIAVVGAVIFGGLMLVPDKLKQSATTGVKAVLSDLVPEPVKDKIEEVVLSPSERRAKLLKDLDSNIESIREKLSSFTAPKAGSPTPAQAQQIIEQELEKTENIIKKLEDANEKQGVVNKVTSKIYETVTGSNGESSSRSNPPEIKDKDIPAVCSTYCAP